MKRLFLLAVLLALAAPAAASAAGAELRVTYWPEGRGSGTPLRWTLRCEPAGGSLPRAADACRKLGAMSRPFAVPPKDRVCTEIYGGPQEAIVAGTHAGRRIWIKLGRSNGCEIARFHRLRFLVPGFVGGGTT
ncbi:MAG TPA: SSI family serine proteinase inhibitor [Gaiellaceae bacterium]|nr:SSI family serine proteinase inhibitor [Gaiellaceae bacterium]